MLEELYAKVKKEDADIVICDYFTNNNNGQHYVIQQPSSLVPQQVMRDMFQQLHGSCCNKLVKRVCYNKIGARFFLVLIIVRIYSSGIKSYLTHG